VRVGLARGAGLGGRRERRLVMGRGIQVVHGALLGDVFLTGRV
jgi:hypothetical protein